MENSDALPTAVAAVPTDSSIELPVKQPAAALPVAPPLSENPLPVTDLSVVAARAAAASSDNTFNIPGAPKPSPLKIARYAKLGDLRPGIVGLNFVLRVHERPGRPRRTALVGDETACIPLTFGKEHEAIVVPGRIIVVRNSFTVKEGDRLVLQVDKFGKISAHPDGVESTPAAGPAAVNLARNLGEVLLHPRDRQYHAHGHTGISLSPHPIAAHGGQHGAALQQHQHPQAQSGVPPRPPQPQQQQPQPQSGVDASAAAAAHEATPVGTGGAAGGPTHVLRHVAAAAHPHNVSEQPLPPPQQPHGYGLPRLAEAPAAAAGAPSAVAASAPASGSATEADEAAADAAAAAATVAALRTASAAAAAADASAAPVAAAAPPPPDAIAAAPAAAPAPESAGAAEASAT